MPIVHRTYTEFDIRAVTVTGLSAKLPGKANPIGKFGTGLKYAIAVLLREGLGVTIVTPTTRYKFVPNAIEFRGQQAEGILMRAWATDKVARPKRQELGFTTHYGSNWELWMAFRELHSNTLDEGGFTQMFNNVPEEHLRVSEGCAIIVEGEAYESEFYNRHKTFLEAGPSTVLETANIKIYELPHEDYVAEYKYYRGLRAGKAEGENKMFLFIYDVMTECYLSEERQVNDFYWNWAVANAIAQCDNEDLIRRVLEAEDDFWESQIQFQEVMKPSETFMRVAATAKVKARHSDYIKAHKPKSIEQLDLDQFPTPWKMTSEMIMAANDNPVAVRPNHMPKEDFKAIWADRLLAINIHAPTLKREADEASPGPAVAAEGDEEAKELAPKSDDIPF